jgi:hypothetical protein
MAKEIILAKMAKDPPIKATTMARAVNSAMSRMGEEFTLQVLVNAVTAEVPVWPVNLRMPDVSGP